MCAINLDPSQEEAFRYIIDNPDKNIFIQGQAGTGKSFLIHCIKEELNQLERQHAVVAPTGIAAELIGGTTIHSMFKLGAHDYFPDNVVDKYKQYQPIVEQISTLIIDEASMLRADVFDTIETLCRKAKNSTAPFGGIQIILIGDLYQLPPVYKNNEEATTFLLKKYRLAEPFFFDAACYEKGNFHFVELSKNHRQQGDDEFFENLRNIGQGNQVKQTLDSFNERVNHEEPNDKISIVTARRDDAQRINKQRLEQIPAKLREFKANATGPYYEGEKRQKRIEEFHVPEILELKTGARVMICKNDPNGRYVNGSMGRIASFGQDSISVLLDDSKLVELQKASWDVQEYALNSQNQLTLKTIGTFEQYPLKLAYAITIHKSQGQTWDDVHIDLGINGAFTSGQVYVALSRVKSIKGVHLQQALTETDIKVNPRVRNFIQNKGIINTDTEIIEQDIDINNTAEITKSEEKNNRSAKITSQFHHSQIAIDYNSRKPMAKWTICNEELENDLYLQAGRQCRIGQYEIAGKVYIFKIKGGTYTKDNFEPNNQGRYRAGNFPDDPQKRDIWIMIGSQNYKEQCKCKNPVDFSKHLWMTIDYTNNEITINPDYS